MKRVMVVVAIVMVLTLALSAGTANAGPGYGQGYGNYGGGQQQVYIVRAGDTLSAIAFRFGVSPFEISRVNGIMNPNLIFSGMCLIIPVRYGPMPGPIGYGPECGNCQQPQCDYCQPQCNYGCETNWNPCENNCYGGGYGAGYGGGYYGNYWGSQVGWYGGGYGCNECNRPQVTVPYAREGFGRKG
jgi:hypothetical protein